MAEQLELFDYELLDPETRGYVRERATWIHRLARQTAEGVRLIGQYLVEVKDRLKHGEFLKWLKAEFAWSEWTARNFMNVHERFKTRNFHDLQIDVSALYLIAAPKTPEPARQELLERAESGERITRAKAIQTIDQQRQKALAVCGEFMQSVEYLAKYHAAASDVWAAAACLGDERDLPSDLELAVRCLLRIQREHPNYVQRPRVIQAHQS